MTARTRLASTIAIVVVLLLYWWSVRAVGGLGSLDRESPPTDYYNHLVAGFVHGHLYMDLPVAPALQALPDPYDPRQNELFRLTDASYFRGRYYLYFGAAPAVTLLLPVRLLTGEYLPTPWAILIFTSIGFLAMAGTFLSLRGRYFATSPAWTASAGILILGIGSTVDVLLRRPFFWELATAGGFAFSMLALASIVGAIHSVRRGVWWMAAAGLFLGLAVASRPTYVYAIPILLAPLFVGSMEPRRPRHDSQSSPTGALRLHLVGALAGAPVRWRMAFAGGATLAGVGLAQFWYNHARFGNGFEFGHNYLLSVAYESKVRLFGWDYFWFNARMYFLRLGQWSWHPPFFTAIPVPRANMPPGFYTVDDPFGLLPVFPVALLALVAPSALRRRAGRERMRLGAIVAATTLLCASAGVVILLYVATIPRYAVDFLPALAVLTCIGLLVAADSHRRSIRAAALLLALVSLGIGATVFFDLGRLVDRTHPALLERVTALTTRLESVFDRLRGVRYGPVTLTARLPVDASPATPLLTNGRKPDIDRVLVEAYGDGKYRFGLQHATAPILWGRTAAVARAPSHAVTIALGSLYPELEHGFFAGADYPTVTWLQHRAVVTVDGETVLSTFAPFHDHRTGSAGLRASAAVSELASVAADPRQSKSEPVPNIFLSFSTTGAGAPARWSIARVPTAHGDDELSLDRESDGQARFVYRHGSNIMPGRESFVLAPGLHRLELRGTENGWAPAADGEHRILAWLDGIRRCDIMAPAFGAAPDDASFAESLPTKKVATGPPDAARRGGALLLRAVLPKGVKNAWIPLLSTGRPGAADVLSIDYMSIDAVQVRFDHWGAPLVMGKTLQLDEAVAHDIEVWLPSFAADAFGQPAIGEVVVKIDGQEALRTAATVFGFNADELVLGENRLRATMDDRYFRGAFVQQVWLGK